MHGRETEMDPPLAGSKPRLRLRLLGLTDLHANLYPYDYYRDVPDDIRRPRARRVAHREGAQRSPQLPFVRQRRCSPGHAARRSRRSSDSCGSECNPSRHRRHEHARLCGGDAWEPRLQLRPRGARARLRASALSPGLLQHSQKRRRALASAFDRNRARRLSTSPETHGS